jgi:hypothetical protein
MMRSGEDHVCMTSSTASITLRAAAPSDDAALARLASLDSRPLRDGQYLLAEDGEQLLAAMSQRDGSVVADPFRFTAEAIELLRRRREQILIATQHPRTRTRRPRLLARHTASRVA